MKNATATPQRMCAACRQVGPRGALVRLVRSPDGKIHPDLGARLPGRGAWVCPEPGCVERLEKHPAILGRSLRAAIDSAGLLDRLKAAALRRLVDELSLAARAGHVVAGAENLAQLLPRGGFRCLVAAGDSSPRSISKAQECSGGLDVYIVGLPRDELGQRVGRAPVAVLAIRSGASSALVQELRRHRGLGYLPGDPGMVPGWQKSRRGGVPSSHGGPVAGASGPSRSPDE